MTEPINMFEPDMVEAVAEYMARYEKGSDRAENRWECKEVQEAWRARASTAIDIAASFIQAQSQHWNAPRKEWFADFHEYMAKSMYFDESGREAFPDDETRNRWHHRAHWAMIGIGSAMPMYSRHPRTSS